jgi:hypothetical protein
MGNDGGSIPTRRELVKTGPRTPTVSELKATAHESLSYSWTHCALTDTPIVPSADIPLAADYLGRIFSYEAVLTALATPTPDHPHHSHHHRNGNCNGNNHNHNHNHDASSSPPVPAIPPSNETPTLATIESFGIHSLRDMVRIYPAAPPETAQEDSWICPLSRKVLGAGTRAVFLVPCGHVFAEVALKEAGEDSCPECGAAFGNVDDSVVLVLATGADELDRAKKRMERLRLRGLTHSLKRDKCVEGGEKKMRKKKRKERDWDDGKGGNTVKVMKVAKES